jgi:hypothetical protein
VLSGGANPSFFRIWRSSPVDRQVPTIEQCRLVLNSQIFVRRAGPAAYAGSSRVISVGGIEASGIKVCAIERGSAKVFAPLRTAAAGPAALTPLLHAWPCLSLAFASGSLSAGGRASRYKPACVTNLVFR